MSNTSRSSQPATGTDAGDARHRRVLVGRDLDADAVVLGQRQQVVDDLEPLGALGIVDPGDLHQLLIAELGRAGPSAASTIASRVDGQRSARRQAIAVRDDQRRRARAMQVVGEARRASRFEGACALTARSSRCGGSSAAAA